MDDQPLVYCRACKKMTPKINAKSHPLYSVCFVESQFYDICTIFLPCNGWRDS